MTTSSESPETQDSTDDAFNNNEKDTAENDDVENNNNQNEDEEEEENEDTGEDDVTATSSSSFNSEKQKQEMIDDAELFNKVQVHFNIDNPTLFAETYTMSFTSAAIFALADVRDACRQGVIKNEPEILQLPVNVSSIITVLKNNLNELKKVMRKASYDFAVTLMDQMEERKKKYGNDNNAISGTFLSQIMYDSTLHSFGDNESKSECVYLLIRNPVLQRIVLCFRGTITVNDWLKDSKVLLATIKNPLANREGQPEMIGVHLGFREYLYDDLKTITVKLDSPIKGPFGQFKEQVTKQLPNLISSIKSNRSGVNVDEVSTKDGIEDDTDGSSSSLFSSKAKVDSIANIDEESSNDKSSRGNRLSKILEEVNELHSADPDFRIYVTGHSLGGALGLLAALEIAAQVGIPENPVTWIGVGNPRGVTIGFRDAVECLEREGKMRCLGMHNHLDIVPLMPTSALHVQTKNNFCQVGFQMLLRSSSFEMRYCPKTDRSWQDLKQQAERTSKALLRADKIPQRHHFLSYLNLIRSYEAPLSKLHLNDYYNEIVEPNLFPNSEKKLTPSLVTTKTGDEKKDNAINLSESDESPKDD